LGQSPRFLREPVRRALIIAALAAGLLIGLRVGWLAPLSGPSPARWAVLYRHAGDTYVRMLYLSGAEPEAPVGRRLLQSALRYYLLSSKTNPSDVETLASLGLVWLALVRGAEAKQAFGNAVLQAQTGEQRRQLSAALQVFLGEQHDPGLFEQARPFLAKLTPGPLVMAAVYDRFGRADLADAERARAEREAAAVRPRMVALVVICGVLALAALTGIVVTLLRWRAWADPSAPGPAWGVPQAVEALILWVFLAVVVASVIARTAFRGMELVGAVAVVPSLVAGCGAIAWVWGTSLKARFGWDLSHAMRSVLLGFGAAGVLTPVALVLEHLLQRTWRPVEHPLVPVFAAASDPVSRAALVVVACAAIPALEETLFRGIVYRALRATWSPLFAAFASALIFAVGHMSWVGFLPYLLIGLMLAWLYERSGTLLAPAVAHSTFNGFNLAILLVLFG